MAFSTVHFLNSQGGENVLNLIAFAHFRCRDSDDAEVP